MVATLSVRPGSIRTIGTLPRQATPRPASWGHSRSVAPEWPYRPVTPRRVPRALGMKVAGGGGSGGGGGQIDATPTQRLSSADRFTASTVRCTW